jgi:antitoxin (DNA-binding transcriptional repressor) of toxin-antitoxin stability system
MEAVNMLQAKSSLSRLVEAIELGLEREIIIARNGRPAARLVPVETNSSNRRLGVAKGLFEVSDGFDAGADEIVQMFIGEGML